MAWIQGTATDYRDMLDQLIEIATSDHVDTVAIVSGGTGHAVDDLITITDGTSTHSAVFRVTSVAGGVIDGIQIEQGGAYTVDPDLTATTAWSTSGSGVGATFDLTMESEPWTVTFRAQEAVSATIADGGTGHSVNDKLTLDMTGGGILGATGETYYGVAPVFNVDSVSSGVVTAVSLDTAGHLEQVPDVDGVTGGSQANTTSGGSGIDCVLTVTYQDVGSSQEDVVLLSAPGESGTEDILMAIRTFQDDDVTGFDTVFNWQMFALVEYNSALALHAQNNISPGADPSNGEIEHGSNEGGAYMILKENDADPDIEFWMSVTNRRLILVCKVEGPATTFYPSMYMGFLNEFGTDAEQPYPIYIQGSSSRHNSRWTDSIIGRITGLSDCYMANGTISGNSPATRGPGFFRAETGATVWAEFKNFACNDTGFPTRTTSGTKFHGVYPAFNPTLQPETDDQITNATSTNGIDFENIFPATGAPGTPDLLLRPTPNTGDDVRPMIPLTVITTRTEGSNPTTREYQYWGEMDNCYWISASDASTNLTSEDIQKVGDERYWIFQNGNQSEVFNYLALKQG